MARVGSSLQIIYNILLTMDSFKIHKIIYLQAFTDYQM